MLFKLQQSVGNVERRRYQKIQTGSCTVHLNSIEKKRFGRCRTAPSRRHVSSAVWIMAVKDGYCYFLIQKVSIKHPFLCTETSLVSWSLHARPAGPQPC